jgi:hypothetical protein
MDPQDLALGSHCRPSSLALVLFHRSHAESMIGFETTSVVIQREGRLIKFVANPSGMLPPQRPLAIRGPYGAFGAATSALHSRPALHAATILVHLNQIKPIKKEDQAKSIVIRPKGSLDCRVYESEPACASMAL